MPPLRELLSCRIILNVKTQGFRYRPHHVPFTHLNVETLFNSWRYGNELIGSPPESRRSQIHRVTRVVILRSLCVHKNICSKIDLTVDPPSQELSVQLNGWAFDGVQNQLHEVLDKACSSSSELCRVCSPCNHMIELLKGASYSAELYSSTTSIST